MIFEIEVCGHLRCPKCNGTDVARLSAMNAVYLCARCGIVEEPPLELPNLEDAGSWCHVCKGQTCVRPHPREP